MTKFTPGPWKCGYSAYNVTADNENMTVCDIRGWGYLTGKGSLGLEADIAKQIQEANAHLIAAAPEIYEALDKIVGRYHATGLLGPDEVHVAMMALKKARGEV